MDNKTKEFLSKLGQQIPRPMMDRAVQRERTQNTEAVMEKIAYSKPKEERTKILKDLKEGKYSGKERFANNSAGGREINKWMEVKIEKAINTGEIERPKDDSFIRKIKDKFNV